MCLQLKLKRQRILIYADSISAFLTIIISGKAYLNSQVFKDLLTIPSEGARYMGDCSTGREPPLRRPLFLIFSFWASLGVSGLNPLAWEEQTGQADLTTLDFEQSFRCSPPHPISYL